jgi:hypothetical protein
LEEYITVLTKIKLIKKVQKRISIMKVMKYSRRIHISPVGFEIDRVVLPLIKLEADKVWLLTERNSKKDKGKPYFDKVINEITNLNRKCEVDVKFCDFNNRDLYDVLRAYREIIEKERTNQIFVNVSTGTKIHSIAGMMACMIFKDIAYELIPYYVEPEKYATLPEDLSPMSFGCKDIHTLPNYRIERPSDYLIEVLSVINDRCGSSNEKITKTELKKTLTDKGLLKLSKKNGKTIKHENIARFLALQRKCIDPLLGWKFIEIIPLERRGKIGITSEGKDMLQFLG